jgi:hypothetical protein
MGFIKKGNRLFHSRQSSIKVIKRMRKAEQTLSITHISQLFNIPVSSYYYQPVDNQNDVIYREQLKTIQ